MRTFEQVLVTSTRDQRERMHELRSTLAGLVTGSAMLDNPAVPAEVRQRMLALRAPRARPHGAPGVGARARPRPTSTSTMR